MSSQAIPDGLVESDYEKAAVWYTYGQKATRDGFRLPEGAGNKNPVLGEFTYPLCRKHEPERKEWVVYCGPFRMDFYTSPIWFPYRDEDTSTLPPR